MRRTYYSTNRVKILVDVFPHEINALQSLRLTGQASFIQQLSSMLWPRKSLSARRLARERVDS